MKSDEVPVWRLRRVSLSLGPRPRLMGIVNVTPDSFSDGGRYADADLAVEHALRLVDHGADILDIGGESTRPDARPVSADEELRRVVPVIERLVARTTTPISVDTSKAVVAQACIDAGVEIVNDVTGFEGDPAMIDLVAETGVGVCIMHMRGTPATMQQAPTYGDVVGEVAAYLAARRDALIAGGVAPDRICIDPGIGFGKTVEHNLALLRDIEAFRSLGAPVLVGHSRKSFLGRILDDMHLERDSASVGASMALVGRAHILRVHDVASTHRAMLAYAAVRPSPPPDRPGA